MSLESRPDPAHTAELAPRKFSLGIKVLIALLYLSALSGLSGGISGVKQIHPNSQTGTEIVRYEFGERLAVLAFGLFAAVTAYGCTKKKLFGWMFTIGLILLLMGITLWSIVRILVASWSNAYVALWWTVQLVAMGLMLRWWLRQKPLFLPAANPRSPGS